MYRELVYALYFYVKGQIYFFSQISALKAFLICNIKRKGIQVCQEKTESALKSIKDYQTIVDLESRKERYQL